MSSGDLSFTFRLPCFCPLPYPSQHLRLSFHTPSGYLLRTLSTPMNPLLYFVLKLRLLYIIPVWLPEFCSAFFDVGKNIIVAHFAYLGGGGPVLVNEMV